MNLPTQSAYHQKFAQHADVAELVDAQVSEACCRKAVEVRFFSSAPISIERLSERTAFFVFCRLKVPLPTLRLARRCTNKCPSPGHSAGRYPFILQYIQPASGVPRNLYVPYYAEIASRSDRIRLAYFDRCEKYHLSRSALPGLKCAIWRVFPLSGGICWKLHRNMSNSKEYNGTPERAFRYLSNIV